MYGDIVSPTGTGKLRFIITSDSRTPNPNREAPDSFSKNNKAAESSAAIYIFAGFALYAIIAISS